MPVSRSVPDRVPVLFANVSLAAVSASVMAVGVVKTGVSFTAVKFTTRFAVAERAPSDTLTT